MTYTNFSIFKNKFKKEGSTQPDYKITAKDELGKFVPIGAGWIKESKSGDKYISCKLSENSQPDAVSSLTDEQKLAIKTARDNEILARERKEINADDVFNNF